MKLDDVKSGPDALLYMERYVDESAKAYSPFAARNEVAPAYRPTTGAPSFELVTTRLPHERAWSVAADTDAALRARYLGPDGVLFPVHPDTWAGDDVDHLDELRTLPRGESIRAVPTASTRTVWALDPPAGVPAHFLKLHLPRRISRFNRRLRRKNIENSVLVTPDLAHVDFEPFAYLPDVIGATCGHETTAWGFLVREAVPRPFRPGRTMMPCFALYAGDHEDPDARPLVVQLIERLGVDPAAFLVDRILVPVVTCWAKVARERGLLLESHAQNTLLELDDRLQPTRIVHRDFDVWVDASARARAGLDVPFPGALIGGPGSDPVGPSYSLVYDHFVGREFFDYLLAAVARFHPIDQDAIRARVGAAFHDAFPDAERVFPKDTTFYFSNEEHPGKSYVLIDTKERPRWR